MLRAINRDLAAENRELKTAAENRKKTDSDVWKAATKMDKHNKHNLQVGYEWKKLAQTLMGTCEAVPEDLVPKRDYILV